MDKPWEYCFLLPPIVALMLFVGFSYDLSAKPALEGQPMLYDNVATGALVVGSIVLEPKFNFCNSSGNTVVSIDMNTGVVTHDFKDLDAAGRAAADIFWNAFGDQIRLRIENKNPPKNGGSL